jgi:hypothetical protein
MKPLFLLLGLLLTGCGEAASDANPFTGTGGAWSNADTTVGGTDYGNRYSAGLARASAGQRAATLAQAIAATDRRCAQVSRAQFKGALEGRAFWAVDCGQGDYLLTIGRQGAVQAQACSVQQDYGPGCWVEW